MEQQNKWYQENYIRAYKFAADAHQGQTVPGTGIPYIMHLSFVSMEIIAALDFHPERDGNLAVQCALLHDTLEDTGTTFEQLAETFGQGVAHGVEALTKDQKIEDKAEKMAECLGRIKQQPEEIWMVKLADRITNLQPPPGHWSKEKIGKYLQEAGKIHEALGEASGYLSSRLLEKIDGYRISAG